MYADPYVEPTYVAPVPTYVPSYEVGRSSNFKRLNCCALLCALTIFGVLIAAATVCWYSYNEQYQGTSSTAAASATSTIVTINSTSSCYDLNGVTTDVRSATGSQTSKYTEYDSSSAVWSTFKLMQAFVLIGLILAGLIAIFLILCFADSLRNKLLFVLGMNVLRIVLLAIALLILISMIIAFLGFLGITNSFSDDNQGCNRGYCRRFSDDTKADLGTSTVVVSGSSQTLAVTQSVNFGPHAGWYLVLACIPIAIILCVIVVLNKFPIPVDSVGSGEAL
jgi:hypothetical protein